MQRKVQMGIFAIVLVGAVIVARVLYSESGPEVPMAGVKIPFELVSNHVMLEARVNDSRPLSFVLDTGSKYSIVELETAKKLGLQLAGEVDVKGAGTETPKGYFVENVNCTVPAFAGFVQPIILALPLGHLATTFGRDFDGILGNDFIQQFASELDYEHSQIILHDKNKYVYSGRGTPVPVWFNSAGLLMVEAEVILPDQKPLKGTFMLDIGSGGSLALHTPLVAERKLLDGKLPTVRAIGKMGAGGASSGRLGRVREFRIGGYSISNPVTMFSQDASGAMATKSELGNIGTQISSRFNIIFDLSSDIMYLEPNSTFSDSFRCTISGGMSIRAEGVDYHEFCIKDILENSPASEADLRIGDMIESIDGQAATDLTLTEVTRLLEQTVTRKLGIRRGDQRLEKSLTPRRMI